MLSTSTLLLIPQWNYRCRGNDIARKRRINASGEVDITESERSLHSNTFTEANSLSV